MKKTVLTLIALCGVAAFSASYAADDAEVLLKTKGCVACHATDAKLVGPSYKDVAAKYAGDADAEEKLISKVRDGGSGVWGPVPMPPHPAISDADLKTMVDWVLALK